MKVCFLLFIALSSSFALAGEISGGGSKAAYSRFSSLSERLLQQPQVSVDPLTMDLIEHKVLDSENRISEDFRVLSIGRDMAEGRRLAIVKDEYTGEYKIVVESDVFEEKSE